MNAVFEAAQYIDASDPSYTYLVYKPGEARDMPVFKSGNYAAPGEIAVVPRGVKFRVELPDGPDPTEARQVEPAGEIRVQPGIVPAEEGRLRDRGRPHDARSRRT